jgi:hypothetical protein
LELKGYLLQLFNCKLMVLLSRKQTTSIRYLWYVDLFPSPLFELTSINVFSSFQYYSANPANGMVEGDDFLIEKRLVVIVVSHFKTNQKLKVPFHSLIQMVKILPYFASG